MLSLRLGRLALTLAAIQLLMSTVSATPQPIPAPDQAGMTTRTSVSSGTRTSTSLINNAFIGAYAAAVTVTETATLYDPRPAEPLASAIVASAAALRQQGGGGATANSYDDGRGLGRDSGPLLGPYTLVQTAISSRTTELALTYYSANGPVETRRETNTYTVPSTWVLWLPLASATAAAVANGGTVREADAGVSLADLPCGGGTTVSCQQTGEGSSMAPPDAECVAKGMQTACQGQCALRDGVWWCYQMYYSDYGTPLQMGRACWGANGTYKQLMRPCLIGDQRIGCSACKGKDIGWNAAKWIWD